MRLFRQNNTGIGKQADTVKEIFETARDRDLCEGEYRSGSSQRQNQSGSSVLPRYRQSTMLRVLNTCLQLAHFTSREDHLNQTLPPESKLVTSTTDELRVTTQETN